MPEISQMDVDHLQKLRDNVNQFIKACGEEHDKEGAFLLDVAPDEHEGAAPFFKQSTIETLNIDPSSGATYVADLCANNEGVIPSSRFDFVVCTEVLEHTLQPFDAVKEIERVLKPGGLVFASSPFNFRIHGPLPDCWRFTEHGWKALFKDFEIIDLKALELEDRFLMPVHYTMVARKRD